MKQTTLVIAAHPDDEALGCGGTMARLAAEGVNVHVAFLADGVSARPMSEVEHDRALEQRHKSGRQAAAVLGINEPRFLDFPDNQLDTVPLLELTQAIEKVIAELKPDTVITHHGGDLNIDHRRVHDAVLTACRPQAECPVRRIWCFEVASSTEWQSPGSAPPFIPNLFIDIGSKLQQKLEALDAYDQEMRDWPHSRSIQAVEHLARWRGASAGYEAAEAFMVVRELL